MNRKLLVSTLCGAAMLLFASQYSVQAEVVTLLKPDKEVTLKEGKIPVKVYFMNAGTEETQETLPGKLTINLNENGQNITVTMDSGAEDETVTLPVGGFKVKEYSLPISGLNGDITLSFNNLTAQTKVVGLPSVVDATGKPATETTTATSTSSAGDYVTGELAQQEAQLEGNEENHSKLGRFFSEHFFRYDPIYFSVGGNPGHKKPSPRIGDFPNARFQISLRYRIFGEEGTLADRWGYITNFYLGYTQRTVWDLYGDSCPFVDSTFKPEFQYFHQNLLKQPSGILKNMDVLASISHESNGRNGSGSRSINYAILRPYFHFGEKQRFHAWAAPGFWTYFGDLSDNPQMWKYHGHLDLRTSMEWDDIIELQTWCYVGDEFNKASAQFDLFYPLWHITDNNLALKLHAQYFTGYGQTLLNYNLREQALRFGLSF